jgi:hypothetical protein
MRDDDAFWAAQRVAAFSDEMIRELVHTGEFSDPAAEKHLADVLIERRNKIARIYLTAVNPVGALRLDAEGRLSFENAAVLAGVAEGPVRYRASWMRFDNATGAATPIASTESATTSMDAPPGIPAAPGTFIQVDIAAESAAHASWREPVRAHFRRTDAGWKLTGFRRLPDVLGASTR